MKALQKTLFIGLLLTVLSLLTGCGTTDADKELNWQTADLHSMESAERADLLSRACDEEMKRLDSYTASMTIEFNIKTGGRSMDAVATNLTQVVGQNSENYQYKNYTKTHMTVGGAQTTTYITEGFKNGYAYRRYEEGSYIRTLKSLTSAEDYKAYLASLEESVMGSITLEGLTYTAESEPTENGWLIKAKNFSESFVRTNEKEMSIYKIFGEYVLEDIEMDIYITSDMHYDRIDIRYVIKDGINTSYSGISFQSVSMVYENLNSTEIKNLSIDDYHEIDDLLILHRLEDSLDAIKSSPDGKLTLQLTQEAVSTYSTLTSTESDTITYQVSDGDLSYTCDTYFSKENDTDEHAIIVYENGERKTYLVVDGTEELKATQSFSKETETAFLEGLLEMVPFDINNIASVTRTSVTGQYKIELSDSTALRSRFSASKIKSCTVTVTFDKDRLTSYEVDLTYSSSIYTVTLKSKAEYERY